MVERLYIEGQELDLIPGSITRKMRVGDLANPTSKLSSFSQQFKLPRTTKNVKLFKMLGVTGNGSNIPYIKNRCDYTADTIPVVSNGFLLVESVDDSFYNVRITDGIVDLAQRLEGKKLSDLPLSDLDHILNAQAMADSFTNTGGYIYAFGDYGMGTGKVEYQSPSVFIYTIWDKIMNDAGIQYQGSFFTNLDFRNEVMTMAQGVKPDYTGVTITNKGTSVSNTLGRYDMKNEPIEFMDTLTLSGSVTGFTYDSGKLKCNVGGRYRFNTSTDWSNFDSYIYVRFKVNGVSKAALSLAKGSTLTREDSIYLNLEPNDLMEIEVFGMSPQEPNAFGMYEVQYNVQIDMAVATITGGQLVEVGNLIGDMSQADFLKDVMARYGLFMTPVKNSDNGYSFIQMDTLLSDWENSIDWTAKLQGHGQEKYDPGVNQANTFTYVYPEGTLLPTHDGVLNITNANLPATGGMYASPFEIPIRKGTFQSEPLYSIPLYENTDDGVEGRESKNKVMSLITKTNSINLYYFAEGAYNYNGPIPILSLENMGMQHFIDEHYKQYKALMDTYIEREVEVYLSPMDLYNLRFDRLYYFAQYGAYFYLQEATSKVGQNAKIKMIQTVEPVI